MRFYVTNFHYSITLSIYSNCLCNSPILLWIFPLFPSSPLPPCGISILFGQLTSHPRDPVTHPELYLLLLGQIFWQGNPDLFMKAMFKWWTEAEKICRIILLIEYILPGGSVMLIRTCLFYIFLILKKINQFQFFEIIFWSSLHREVFWSYIYMLP